MMKCKPLMLALAALTVLCAGACRPKYETVAGDPMETKIHTLKNGLKIYMTVNKETPRIQTFIAVRTGGKNDPADNTGLAHYLEHIMFKGTPSFGTSDYEAEKPMLEEIRQLFDVFGTTTDPAEREALYHRIDSVSYEASRLAIPNEYDKLMSLIGSQGSNAFTSNDVTCYQEDIPSNQVENWAKVQADRFKNMVVRGFHTELEAVYEEYNMGLTDDMAKAMEAVDSVLFPHHPYGKQTVIGTQEHLKNPSITAILKQKATYYVPNNCAICASGDFDPDEFVRIIEQYFGDWEPNPDLPAFTFEPETPLTAPVEKDVYGNEAEFAFLSWRCPGDSQADSELAPIVASILYNGMAGLIDLDINQQQKTLGAGLFHYGRTDYGEMILYGYPKEGQSLQEVRALLLDEVAALREGRFDEEMVTAAVNNFKLMQMRALENNRSRAMRFVECFVAGRDWKTDVELIDRLSRTTREDVVAWARQFLAPESCVTAYKHTAPDPNIKKIQAPKITPIATNRDRQSEFLAQVQDTPVPPVEPVFTDYAKDLSVLDYKGQEVLYKQNVANDIATLTLRFEKGRLSDPRLETAFDYAGYLGTPTRSAEEIACQMYVLGCRFFSSVSDSRTTLTVTGLDENLGKALDIVEDLYRNARPDEAVLQRLKADILKSRADDKLNQSACEYALENYLLYGPEYIRQTTLTNGQVAQLQAESLLEAVRDMFTCAHEILYYGPSSPAALEKTLAEHHPVPDQAVPLETLRPVTLPTPEPRVYVAHYDSRQFSYIQFSDRGERYEPAQDPYISLFNEYFGAGMNTIVFQEMREARALAYHASARLDTPSFLDDTYSFSAEIGSQNDKLQKAVEAFDLIINEMPESDKSFEIARSALDAKLRTARVTGARVLTSYLALRDLGLTEPRERLIFEKLGDLTLADLKATQEKWVKDRTYHYAILGDTRDLDMAFLRTLGPVQVLSLEDIFGY